MLPTTPQHIVLIGAGIMSATLAVMLTELEPNLHITVYERLPNLAAESSDAMNNAGTGHSANCELNYTPQNDDGTIDISKAVKIATSYEMSKTLWAYLVKQGYFTAPETFINNLPHISYVQGEADVAFLAKRYTTMKAHPLFASMEYTTDYNTMYSWMPLTMHFTNHKLPHAATKVQQGTDVNFGQLTNALFSHLQNLPNVTLLLQHEVRNIEKQPDGTWHIKIKNLLTHESSFSVANYIFIGAGGGTLPLLEKADIPEAEGYGGFPVSGQWLVCNNEAVIAQHHAKVYGMASVGAPPMSVPHLDTRIIDGKKELLFGPFAGFSTKFLKNGSYFDLPLSIDIHNVVPMLSAGWHNMQLTKYLIEQVSLTHEQRIDALRQYYPMAKSPDWELMQAGQRVQVIKKDAEQGGILEFGTEIITTADGTLSGLLGASPGASTAVYIMLQIIKKCFAIPLQSPQWQAKLTAMLPMHSTPVTSNYEQWLQWRKDSDITLNLND